MLHPTQHLTPNNRIFPIAFRVVTAPRRKRAAQRALSARAARGWVCKLQLPPRRLLGAGSRAFGQTPPQPAAGRACRQQRCGGAALGGAAGPRSGPAPRRLPAPCGTHRVPGVQSLVCLNQNKPARHRTNFSQIFRLFAFRVLGRMENPVGKVTSKSKAEIF